MSDLPFEESLRTERNLLWNELALAAKTNSRSPEQICSGWSHAADALLTKAFHYCFPLNNAALFAFGKLGSEELNLSSDVDILIVCQEYSADLAVSLRNFQRTLHERTFLGFVFRLDFDLRPGGKQGPLIPTLDQLKDYYGNYGETWERLAFVRLRGLCGQQEIQDDVLAFAKKFSFRKHLDFTLLDDLKQLRFKIQDHYWSRTQDQVIDLKLGIGGIRDVELFTHALQVIHGGRDPSLQVKGTPTALRLLAERNLLPLEETEFLATHYWNLRRLENYVQALADEQTHLLKLTEPHPDFVMQSLSHLKPDMLRCESIVKTLLGEIPEDVNLDRELKDVGFLETEIQELWSDIIGQTAQSRHKERDETARKAFLLEFLKTLKEQKGDVRRGLLLLKDFIQSTRAKATLFSMLVREKNLQQELAWLFGHSPYLSRIICSRPELLDSFIYRSQDQYSSDLPVLLEALAEKRLLSELINGSAFLKSQNLWKLTENLSSTADEIIRVLLEVLKKDHPSKIQILALGKWGGSEMGLRSDLDFIFVLPDDAEDNDFKLARRLVTRLTESHRGGSIYSIDMRLRPSGKAGPLVMIQRDLEIYLVTEAAAWERQAYLKARFVNGDQTRLQASYIQKGLLPEDLQELNRIRLQLTVRDSFNLKLSEGGLVDIELAAQTACLMFKILPPSTHTLDILKCLGSDFADITANYERLRHIEQMQQLIASESLSQALPKTESFHSLAVALQTTSQKLENELQTLFADNCRLLKKLDPRRGSL